MTDIRISPITRSRVTGCGSCPLFCGQFNAGYCALTDNKVSDTYPNHELDFVIHLSCPLESFPDEEREALRESK